MGELLPTQRGVAVGGLVKESNSNTMAASKNLDTMIHCSFSLISSLGSHYSFWTSTTVGTMEVLQIFNNGLTGGKIFFSSYMYLWAATDNGKKRLKNYFFSSFQRWRLHWKASSLTVMQLCKKKKKFSPYTNRHRELPKALFLVTFRISLSQSVVLCYKPSSLVYTPLI